MLISTLAVTRQGTFMLIGNPDAPAVFVHKSRASRPLAAQRPAVSAHFIYQRSNGIYRRLREDSVAEIENVAGRWPECIEHAPRCFANGVRGRE